jgi:hypothetical protein
LLGYVHYLPHYYNQRLRGLSRKKIMTYILTNGRLSGLSSGSDYGMTYGCDTYGRFEVIKAQIAGTGAQTFT